MKEAFFYATLENGEVQCNLCCHRCKISPDKKGICRVRENRKGKFYSLVYGKPIAVHIDPIEKKPLFHFFPGSRSLSVATVGCNFRCKHCQNFNISQSTEIEGEEYSPQELVTIALNSGCKTISYTYTEPTIYFEFAFDIAEKAIKEGIKNIFVTNGFMTSLTLSKIKPYLHGANVDLKSFSNKFYREICGAKLEPVLESIQTMKDMGIWVEVTTLIIPTLNDSREELTELARFLASVGSEIPWHVSQFYPTYKMVDLYRTPKETLKMAREIGYKEGLRYVYCGNIPSDEGENTYCFNCGKILIKRYGFQILENRLKEGKCPYCSANQDGVWLYEKE
ncbi:MAG: AmmeMemoRadiSam system radical SAM enzyme [Thermodesulfobacteriota bacterium]|nr:AmmeMemoRadiSam system radical SAM enzyme [Thermodesulfobacteriota bacterium]